MPPTKTWKSVEARIAKYFGSRRTPLSGGNSGHTRSDSLHKRLFIEDKYRVKHTAITLWDDTKSKASLENKTPVVCLSEKGRPGFWVLVHSDNLEEVAHERKIARENQQDILERSKGTIDHTERSHPASGGSTPSRGQRDHAGQEERDSGRYRVM